MGGEEGGNGDGEGLGHLTACIYLTACIHKFATDGSYFHSLICSVISQRTGGDGEGGGVQ